MKISEVKFSDLSDITYRMFLYEEPPEEGKFRGDEYMLIKFAGRHGIGSEGINDSLFMEAVIKAAMSVWYKKGLIHNLRGLAYEWGNSICDVLLAGKHIMGRKFPTAVVVSELCRPALEGAGPFYRGSPQSGEQEQWLFDDVDSALSYVKGQADKLKAEEEQKRRKKSIWRRRMACTRQLTTRCSRPASARLLTFSYCAGG